ncbi:MAG: SoxR reducing system RseC family protein [Odoribacter sp.]
MIGKGSVQHEGIIKSISPQTIEVVINSHSACSDCHAKGACGMADVKQKIITARRPEGDVQIGDSVIVYATMNHAIYSVVLAYILPSVVVVAAIFFLEEFGSNELLAAIGSLLLLSMYFFGLYIFRDRINKKIKFTVER